MHWMMLAAQAQKSFAQTRTNVDTDFGIGLLTADFNRATRHRSLWLCFPT